MVITIDDMLMVGVDMSPYDDPVLVVMRQVGKEIHQVNTLRKEEAIEIYKKLIGEDF